MYTDFKINMFYKGEGSRRCEDKRPKTDTYARAQTYSSWGFIHRIYLTRT